MHVNLGHRLRRIRTSKKIHSSPKSYTYVGIQDRQDHFADDSDGIRCCIKLVHETLMPCIYRVLQDFFQYFCKPVLAKALIGEHEAETLDKFFRLQRVEGEVLADPFWSCIIDPFAYMLSLLLFNMGVVTVRV